MKESLQEIEKNNEHLNLTPLFENEETQRSKIAYHKRAHDMYKNYSFLKAGLRNPEAPLSSKEGSKLGKANPNEMHKFPSEDALVDVLIHRKEQSIDLLDQGEQTHRPGRN